MRFVAMFKKIKNADDYLNKSVLGDKLFSSEW
jgi:hypothetical protein